MIESEPETLEVGIVALRQGYNFQMQLRNGEENSGGIGLIGFFGGKLKIGETSIEAASRELGEETNVRIKPRDLKLIDTVKVQSDHKGVMRWVVADIFGGELDASIPVYARKGELVTWTLGEVLDNIDRLTPATRAYFERNF